MRSKRRREPAIAPQAQQSVTYAHSFHHSVVPLPRGGRHKRREQEYKDLLLVLLLSFFLLSIYSLSCNIFTKDEFDMLSLRSSSIYCRYASIRYEINPSFAKQTYRVRQHISNAAGAYRKSHKGFISTFSKR